MDLVSSSNEVGLFFDNKDRILQDFNLFLLSLLCDICLFPIFHKVQSKQYENESKRGCPNNNKKSVRFVRYDKTEWDDCLHILADVAQYITQFLLLLVVHHTVFVLCVLYISYSTAMPAIAAIAARQVRVAKAKVLIYLWMFSNIS